MTQWESTCFVCQFQTSEECKNPYLDFWREILTVNSLLEGPVASQNKAAFCVASLWHLAMLHREDSVTFHLMFLVGGGRIQFLSVLLAAA